MEMQNGFTISMVMPGAQDFLTWKCCRMTGLRFWVSLMVILFTKRTPFNLHREGPPIRCLLSSIKPENWLNLISCTQPAAITAEGFSPRIKTVIYSLGGMLAPASGLTV